MNSPASLRDQAIRLMTFLARTQELKEKNVRDVRNYGREGAVKWFYSFPEHSSITLEESAEPGKPFLTIARIQSSTVPALPEEIESRVSRPVDDPDLVPKFLLSTTEISGDENSEILDEEKLRRVFESWENKWRVWAAEEKKNKDASEFYTNLFQLKREVTKHSEEMELIVGVGLLTWTPSDHDPVQRHLYTVPVNIDLDAETGVLGVSISEEAFELKTELDMLDPSAFGSQDLPSLIKSRAEELVPLEINQQAIEGIARPTAHDLAAQGRFLNILGVPEQSGDPVLSFSPALILRNRRQSGLSKIFRTIATQIDETGEVPDGLKPLLDPDLEPSVQLESKPGAITRVGDEIFSPLPLNDVQRKILDRVDNHAQTLVQGPPGTGKTHTAAALLTHLLAQGKRVLVTAKTDRALYEVRDKLPAPIKPLAVSVIGTSRNDMAELTSAVDTISKAADDFDNALNEQAIAVQLNKIDDLRMTRQRLINEVVESYSADSKKQEAFGYVGTSAELARSYLENSSHYSWAQDFPGIFSSTSISSTQSDLLEWLELMRDSNLDEDAPNVTGEDPLSLSLPNPKIVQENLRTVHEAKNSGNPEVSNKVRKLADSVSGIPEYARTGLVKNLPILNRSMQRINGSPHKWMIDAFDAMRFGAFSTWNERAKRLEDAIAEARGLAEKVGENITVEMQGDWRTYRPQADRIAEHIRNNGPLATKSDGRIKIGLLSPAVIKESRPFLEDVKINGSAPSTLALVDSLRHYMELSDLLREFENRWVLAGTSVSVESPSVRISELEVVLKLLESVLIVAKDLVATDKYLADQGAPAVSWGAESEIQDYCAAIEYRTYQDKVEQAQKPLRELSTNLERLLYNGLSAAWLKEMLHSVESEDAVIYERAYAESMRLSHSGRRIERRDELAGSLKQADSKLVLTVTETTTDPLWDERFNSLQEAANWLSLGQHLNAMTRIDPNKNQSLIKGMDDQIRAVTSELAALRAWGNAVRPERLSRTSRASLTHYVQQVRKLGKGTGKYAGKQRAAVQRALDACRPAVPVWIMPISRIVDQLAIEENLFDVVLIDEASQAGMEATFLQYLAPKIVVIGDDKQVSPSAVGQDQQQIMDLAHQYIKDIKFLDSWQDATKSLFDDANLRFGGKLTLVEHRRCVPEIINFSNRIAYEPEKIQLIPVRQVKADRLAPFKIVFTKHGYQKTSRASKVNPVEADALVDQLVNCIKNPEYDGLTFGVISLLGPAQAKLIEGRLLARVDAREWESRKLMVGIAPDFQGAERDVMFLSMVAATEEGHRNAALTSDRYIQRFNVAVSRAKDQVWIFHSIPLESLNNKEDMRFQLLDYAYGVVRQQETMAEIPAGVPNDERAEPFDSLFEQRVYNQIAARGFMVKPQQEALGYSIDLVVSGTEGKIAVECDGDYWHGPDQYESDLARQRDLERCGWEFFRIRESEYYLDPVASMQGLWTALENKGIHPSGWVKPSITSSENVIVLDGSEEREVDQVSERFVALSDDSETIDIDSRLITPPDSPAAAINIAPAHDAVYPEAQEIVPDPYHAFRAAPQLFEIEEPGNEPDLFSLDAVPSHSETKEEPLEVRASSTQLTSMVDEAFGDADQSEDLGYEKFCATTVHAKIAEVDEVIAGVIAILEIEGPVIGKYLIQTYNQASGGKRATRDVTKKLNVAISKAKRLGKIVEDNPLSSAGNRLCTYRLPGQPEYRIRPLGPRKLDDVPPAELLASAREVANIDMDEEEIMRAILRSYGRTSLTEAARLTLQPILDLMAR